MMFEDQDCITCFMQFRVPQGFTAARRRDGRSFYCPNGHSMSYPLGESEADKLRRERDRLVQRMAEKDDTIHALEASRARAERKASAARGHVTKIKKRAANGVCPCCNRTFADLARHMGTKHPGYVSEPTSDEHVH